MYKATVAEAIEEGFNRLAGSITAQAMQGTDATGGTVYSLTESVMGITAALVAISSSIDNLAEAIRETQPN
jgi:hypothetical protein